MMNKTQLLGTMTRDCEINYTQTGTVIGTFSVAWNEKRKQQDGSYKDTAHFFECTAWGRTAENISKYFHKGSRILIDGRLNFSQWEKDGQKRSKVDIIVERFDFIDRSGNKPQQQAQQQPQRQAQQPPQQPQQQAQQQPRQQQFPEILIDEESIPF